MGLFGKGIGRSVGRNDVAIERKSPSFPLHDAAHKGRLRIKALLLEHGHHIAQFDEGLRASDRAHQAGIHDFPLELEAREAAAEVAVSSSPLADRLTIKELFSLVHGKSDAIAGLIKARRVHAVDGKGDTPLHICAAQGRLQFCDQLITAGADPAAQNFEGMKPHDRAAENGHAMVAELLRSLLPDTIPKLIRAAAAEAVVPDRFARPEVSPPLKNQADDAFDFDDLDLDFDGKEEAEAFHEELGLDSYDAKFEVLDGRVARLGDEDGADLEFEELDDGGFRIKADDIIARRPQTAEFADQATFRSFLDVRRGPSVSRKETAPSTRYHAIADKNLHDWIAWVIDNGNCTLDDIDELVGCIRGSFDVDTVRDNLIHELTSLGLLLSDEDTGWPYEARQVGQLPDADDLEDLVSSICNGSNMRPGMELAPISGRAEARLFEDMASSYENICRTLVGDSMLVAVVVTLGEQVKAGAVDPALVTELDIQHGRQTPDSEVLSAALSYLVGFQTLLEEGEVTAEDRSHALEAVLALKLSEAAIGLITKSVEANSDLEDARQRIVRSAARRAATVEKIALSHLPFLRCLAFRYTALGDPEDALQNGFFGLLKAIERFDLNTGYRLMTYSQFHIRNCISRAFLDTGKLIRLPVHVAEKLRRAENAQEYLPLNVGPDILAEIVLEKAEISWREYERLKNIASEFEEFDESDYEPLFPEWDQFDHILAGQAEVAVCNVLAGLDDRKRTVLEMRFGFGEYDEHTLEECGAKFGVTRERIRQIEVNALQQLKHPSRSKLLRELL